jgi:hypothetical protein
VDFKLKQFKKIAYKKELIESIQETNNLNSPNWSHHLSMLTAVSCWCCMNLNCHVMRVSHSTTEFKSAEPAQQP